MRLKVSNVCQLLDKNEFRETHVNNGITYTNNGNGTFTLNGTTTSASGSGIYSSDSSVNIIKANHKYLMLGFPIAFNGYNYVYFQYYPFNTSIKYYILNNANGYLFFTPMDDGNRWNIFLSFKTTGFTVNNITIKPQLFDLTEMYGAGNEPTTVAQFRQDFPNEMYEYSPVCWKKFRRLKYVTETKNLFKFSNEVGTLNGGFDATAQRDFEENKWYIGLIASGYYAPENILSFSINGNLIYFKRVSNASGYGIARAFKCVPNTTYTVSCKTIVEDGIYSGIFISYFDKDGRILSWNTDLSNNKTITTPADCNWLVLIMNFYAPDGRVSEVYFTDIQLELGSTATPYQPYGYLPLNRGKYIANKEPVQLLDKTKFSATQTMNGVTFTNNGDGTITVNGTTNEVYVNYIIPIPQFKEVKNDHKYVLFSGINDISDDSLFECIFFIGRQDGSYFVRDCVETKLANAVGFVIPQGEYSLWQRVELRVRRGYTANDLTFKPQLFDLTAMYGAGNEPTTVEQFRADFPNELYDYNPYNAITFR